MSAMASSKDRCTELRLMSGRALSITAKTWFWVKRRLPSNLRASILGRLRGGILANGLAWCKNTANDNSKYIYVRDTIAKIFQQHSIRMVYDTHFDEMYKHCAHNVRKSSARISDTLFLRSERIYVSCDYRSNKAYYTRYSFLVASAHQLGTACNPWNCV